MPPAMPASVAPEESARNVINREATSLQVNTTRGRPYLDLIQNYCAEMSNLSICVQLSLLLRSGRALDEITCPDISKPRLALAPCHGLRVLYALVRQVFARKKLLVPCFRSKSDV